MQFAHGFLLSWRSARGFNPRAAILFMILAPLTGCQQRMAEQPSCRPLEASSFFADGRAARSLVPGTVSRGQLALDRISTGMTMAPTDEETTAGAEQTTPPEAHGNKYVASIPIEVDLPLIERGRERYGIFCVVCHDPLGTGEGMIVQRGFTKPPSLHDERLRHARVGYLFEVITNGYGAMPDYSEQIPARDRWAIVSYVRALQLSQRTQLDALPKDTRDALLRELEE